MLAEDGEQCDPGVQVALSHEEEDKCCTADCKFTPGSVCRSFKIIYRHFNDDF
jgi:hypothetical protein